MSTLATLENPALALLASFVLPDGRRWGEAAYPWQWEDAAAILNSGRCLNHYVTRPRGGSKTSDMGAITLVAMLTQAPDAARLYALAADRDQGRLLLDVIRGFTLRTPFLAGTVEMSAHRVVSGREVVLEVLAADAASSWGLLPYFVVVDELAQWAETRRSLELWEAMRTSTVKQGARLAIITTAGDPTHFAYEIREHARIDPMWRLHEVPGPVPWIDPEQLEEQKRALPESSFRRLHLNIWSEGENRLAALEDLRLLVTHDGALPPQPGLEYVIGVDLGLVHDRTAAALCHLETSRSGDGEPRVVVDFVETWQGTREHPVRLREVGEWLLAATQRYRGARIIIDPYEAHGLIQDLKIAGVDVKKYVFGQTSAGRLGAALLLAVRNRALALPNDPDLIRELARVRLKETAPNIFRIDHVPGEHDDRAIAVALAVADLRERASSPAPQLRVLRSGNGRRNRRL